MNIVPWFSSPRYSPFPIKKGPYSRKKRMRSPGQSDAKFCENMWLFEKYLEIKGKLREKICVESPAFPMRGRAWRGGHASMCRLNSCRVLICKFFLNPGPGGASRWTQKTPMWAAISSLVQFRADSMATANSVVVRLSAHLVAGVRVVNAPPAPRELIGDVNDPLKVLRPSRA